MRVGIVGLGKMGRGIARRLIAGGVEIVGMDPNSSTLQEAAAGGVRTVSALSALVPELPEPRTVWIMVPAGDPVEEILFGRGGLATLLTTGDIVVDGGNSFYEDTQRRAARLKKHDIVLVDIGVSGGVVGETQGYALMVGGEKAAVDRLQPILRVLAADGGVGHVGPSGAGHFVKMVHNGIEYGMMESLAEGVDLLVHGPLKNLDVAAIAGIWNHGGIIRSYLLELLAEILRAEDLSTVVGAVEETGEGRWSVETARKYRIDVPAIAAALAVRTKSQERERFSAKLLALLRQRFGGHSVKRVP